MTDGILILSSDRTTRHQPTSALLHFYVKFHDNAFKYALLFPMGNSTGILLVGEQAKQANTSTNSS